MGTGWGPPAFGPHGAARGCSRDPGKIRAVRGVTVKQARRRAGVTPVAIGAAQLSCRSGHAWVSARDSGHSCCVRVHEARRHCWHLEGTTRQGHRGTVGVLHGWWSRGCVGTRARRTGDGTPWLCSVLTQHSVPVPARGAAAVPRPDKEQGARHPQPCSLAPPMYAAQRPAGRVPATSVISQEPATRLCTEWEKGSCTMQRIRRHAPPR